MSATRHAGVLPLIHTGFGKCGSSLRHLSRVHGEIISNRASARLRTNPMRAAICSSSPSTSKRWRTMVPRRRRRCLGAGRGLGTGAVPRSSDHQGRCRPRALSPGNVGPLSQAKRLSPNCRARRFCAPRRAKSTDASRCRAGRQAATIEPQPTVQSALHIHCIFCRERSVKTPSRSASCAD